MDPVVKITICPLCAAYVEVEQGWDEPSYVWSCDHEYLLDNPAQVAFSQWIEPSQREAVRSALCRLEWMKAWNRSEEVRKYRDEEDYVTLTHPLGLTYTRADRRKRYEYRRLSYPAKIDANLKHEYAEPIREALNQGSVFLATVLEGSRDAEISIKQDLHKQMFGDDKICVTQKTEDDET